MSNRKSMARHIGALGAIALSWTLVRPAFGAAPESGAAPSASSPSVPIMTATRQSAFTIPFRIEPPQSPAEAPVEVQLHVSTTEGASWELSSRVKPEKGSFVFRAPHDGEYWYAIRTVDKQGVARPDALQPQLKVVVDTVAPRLDLTATRGEAGEIVARWQAVDPHLKPGSLKLEYQAQPSGAWEAVAVGASPSAMRHTLSGEARWWPRTTAGSIQVRAEVTDLAGNPAVNQATVKLSDAASAGTAPSTGTEAARGAVAESARWPADRQTSDPLPHANGLDGRTGGADRDSSWRVSKEPARAGSGRLPAQPVGQSSVTRGGSSLPFHLLPAGERPRMVSSRSFELEYEVDSVGPSGIGKVELWGTRDGGRSWTSFGVDTDNRSPIAVAVDGEGIFGFRIVVQSGSGLGAAPPREGDMPQIWIGVDLTRPTCRITSSDVSPDGSELSIRWEAHDDVPDPRPVSLAFSTTPQGPWTPIAAGLENSGSYHWRLDSRVPDRVFIRLEVRDEAGNVGSFETSDAVPLDRHRPEGRIRGVRPVG